MIAAKNHHPPQCLKSYLDQTLQRVVLNEKMKRLFQPSYREIKFELPLGR